MNDRFKFRAWDKKKKHYIGEDYPDKRFDDYEWDEWYAPLEYMYLMGMKYIIINQDFIVEQCTGLKDINEKLIYEGDILFKNGMYRKVFWIDDEGGFGYEPSTLFEPLQTQTCEIVGNIHENADLLKGED